MIDFERLLLLIVITVLTTILVIIGIQLIFILRDTRKLIDKIGDLIEKTEKTIDNIRNPFQNLSFNFESLRDGIDLFKSIMSMIHPRRSSKVETYIEDLDQNDRP